MHDSHIHSNFSKDSHMSAQEACKKAVETGLNGLVFTDHVDFDYPDIDFGTINFNEYFDYFLKLKKEWQPELDIQIGVEIGYQPQVLDENLSLLDKYSFDFVINSVHVIDKLDPYFPDTYFKGRTQREAYERYLQEILYSVNAFDNYDVVGHIGYAARYGNFKDKHLRYLDYSDILDQILKAAIEKGKGIELNTSGLRSDLKSPIPGYDIFGRYLELGGEIITIGSDAHYVEYVGHSFDEALECLKNIGFKYITHFEGRKPVFEHL